MLSTTRVSMMAKVMEFFRHKRRRQAFWAGAGILLYALIGFLLVPWILGKVIPTKAGDLLGRKVSVERIRINPFVLSGSFQGAVVEDTDGSPLLSWEEVYGNLQLSSIFHWAPTFKEVRIVSPYVHFQINPDQTFNVSDIIERLAKEPEQVVPGSQQPPPALRVARLTITNAVARVSDLTLREPFHRQIGPVNLTLKKFQTDPKSENPYSFAGSTETGEHFAWSGRFFLAPLRSEGHLTVESVRIPDYAPFYRDFVSLTVSDGVIDLSGNYRIRLDGIKDLLSVSNVAFHLTSLKVTADVDSARNALEVGELKVTGVDADLGNRAAHVASVAVNGGGLFVRRDRQAHINLLEMTQPSVTNARPAGAVLYAMTAVTNLISSLLTSTNQAIAVVDTVEVDNWALQLEDDANARPVRLRIDDIQLRASNLSNLPDQDISLAWQCRWNTNGTIKLEAGVRLFPIRADVRVQLDHIELSPLDPYAEPFANVRLLDGNLTLDGRVRIRHAKAHAPFDVDFDGDLSLDDFSTVDGTMGTDLLGWKSVEVSGIEANLHPLEVGVERVAILDANATLVVETNRSINLLNAMNLAQDDAQTPGPPRVQDGGSKPAAEPGAKQSIGASAVPPGLALPAITVSSVMISNATLELRDASTRPPLRWSVAGITGEIGQLSSTNRQRADLTMTARANDIAPVEIAGEMNPLNPALDTDLTVKINDMDLLPFGPYSGRYAGYQLRKGSLSLDLEYHVRGRKLDSENRIVVDQLSLGKKVESAEATKLPVKLGVAILKDRNGVIELDVPIEGDLDDPEFRLGRVIGRTIMVTLTKMLSSPFSLLGAIAGGTGEELSTFDFVPGSASIQPAATNGLQKLAKALYERPGLEVEIQGSVSAESDGLAIRKQKLTRHLQQLRWQELRESARAHTRPESVVLSPDLRIAMLRKYYVQVFPERARSAKAPPGLEDTFYEQMTNKLLEQTNVSQDDLQHLAAARAQAIETYLMHKGGVEPERLFLTNETGTPLLEGSKVLLQLQ